MPTLMSAEAGYLTHSVAHIDTHWQFLHEECKQKQPLELNSSSQGKLTPSPKPLMKSGTCCLLYCSITHTDFPPFWVPVLLLLPGTCSWPLLRVWLCACPLCVSKYPSLVNSRCYRHLSPVQQLACLLAPLHLKTLCRRPGQGHTTLSLTFVTEPAQ